MARIVAREDRARRLPRLALASTWRGDHGHAVRQRDEIPHLPLFIYGLRVPTRQAVNSAGRGFIAGM
jgi:hypothetical protein